MVNGEDKSYSCPQAQTEFPNLFFFNWKIHAGNWTQQDLGNIKIHWDIQERNSWQDCLFQIQWSTHIAKAYVRLLSYLITLIKPTGHVMHQQFNIQQLYALPTLYLCILYLSENKQRLVPLTA
jgi:hypothetical protein